MSYNKSVHLFTAACFQGKLCKSHNSRNVFWQSEHSCCLAPQHLATLLTQSHPSWPSHTPLCVCNGGGISCASFSKARFITAWRRVLLWENIPILNVLGFFFFFLLHQILAKCGFNSMLLFLLLPFSYSLNVEAVDVCTEAKGHHSVCSSST